MPEPIKILLELSKIKITLAVALTTALGFIMAVGRIESAMFFCVLGTFLLACGSAGLNHYQEYDVDGMMKRTRERPVPSDRIKPRNALILASLLGGTGAFILLYKTNLAAFFIGILSLIWYNGIYTPLKRVTMWATIVGAVIGALPLMIGWISGGGDWKDSKILSIAFFLMYWQPPHFWLLLLLHRDDYTASDIPALTKRFTPSQIGRGILCWIIAGVCVCLLIILAGVMYSPLSQGMLLVLFLGLIGKSLTLWHNHESKHLRSIFFHLNLYAFLVMLLMCVDKLWATN